MRLDKYLADAGIGTRSEDGLRRLLESAESEEPCLVAGKDFEVRGSVLQIVESPLDSPDISKPIRFDLKV